jgi:hypothetical protein
LHNFNSFEELDTFFNDNSLFYSDFKS